MPVSLLIVPVGIEIKSGLLVFGEIIPLLIVPVGIEIIYSHIF